MEANSHSAPKPHRYIPRCLRNTRKIKSRTHIFRQRQQGAQAVLFSRWFPPLPRAHAPQLHNHRQEIATIRDRAIGQTGEEERGGRIFAIQQNELAGNKRREEVGQLTKDSFYSRSVLNAGEKSSVISVASVSQGTMIGVDDLKHHIGAKVVHRNSGLPPTAAGRTSSAEYRLAERTPAAEALAQARFCQNYPSDSPSAGC